MKKNIDKIYAEALYEVLSESEGKESEVISVFLRTLNGKNHLYRINKILKEFEVIFNKKNNISQLKIKSANELSEDIIVRIAKALNIEKYELETEVDKDMIGGFTARYEDNLIDFSLKNNLKRLHNKLIG